MSLELRMKYCESVYRRYRKASKESRGLTLNVLKSGTCTDFLKSVTCPLISYLHIKADTRSPGITEVEMLTERL